MKATNKRLVSILLVLAMVLAVLPMAVFAAGTTTIYCDAPDNWTACYVHFWGGDAPSSWPGVAMTQGTDGIWYAEVDSTSTGILFHNNAGTQCSDLAMPTDDNVQYNYEAKTWSTYGAEVEVPETVYYLRGTMNEWGTSNPFTNNGDGTYTCVMDLAAGSYEYKAGTEDWGWSCPSGGNLTMTLEADDTVTFTLDINANSLTYTLASGTVVEVEYYLRGSMNEWAADDASKMTKQADGTYAITLNLDAGTYEYKAATADWSFSVPGGDNAVLILEAATAVTFVLNVEEGTLTNDAPVVEQPEPEPVEYTYYVAGSEGLTGVEWDPAGAAMTEVSEGIWTITFENVQRGTYEYKVTTGSWDTPSYGYGEGNLTVKILSASDVTITFVEETTEVTCDVEVLPVPGANDVKWQLNGDASAEAESVDLRLVTWVDSLDYNNVTFTVTIDGQVAELVCETVYTAVKADGALLTCEDVFGSEGYLATYTITDLTAEYYESEITVSVSWEALDGTVSTSETRAIFVSDDWA